MKRTKWIALLLAVSLLVGTAPAVSAAGVTPIAPAFTDISDPTVAESADLLRLLGIVNGTGGTSFRPQNTLTRAEFAKMAIELLGEGGQAASQMNRTIFRDVPSTHWARGYIHVAAQATTGENAKVPLIRGDGAGYFRPNEAITFAEATTILMRVLGYSDDTVGFGSAWYDGYLATAAQIGLTENVTVSSPLSSITRGDAAILFANAVYTTPREGKDVFLVTSLGGSITDSQLVLEVKGKTTSDGGWTLRTAEKSYRTHRDNLSTGLQGQRCKLVLDKKGDVLALQRDEDYSTRTLRLTSSEARYVMTQEQEQILVDPATPVFQSGESRSTTYGEIYAKELYYGSNAVFCYDKAGSLQSIYLLSGSSSTITAVATPGSDPFRPLFSSTTPAVYKNGCPASLSDIKPYDVGVFDGNANTLNLSDRKLTGVYENATPSVVSPSKLTVMGAELDVLDCALKDLLHFKLGDRVTLLLDGQNNVAGVVSPDAVSGEVFGIASITQTQIPHQRVEKDENGNDYTYTWYTNAYAAEVDLSLGITVKGEVDSSVPAMERAPGQLVRVSSTESGKLRLSSITANTAPGSWRPMDAKLGSMNVIPQVAVYDKVGTSPLVRVKLSQVTAPTVAISAISYYHLDNSGQVDLLVLNDVTGECYTYGLAEFSSDSGSNPSLKVSAQGETSLNVITNHSAESLDGTFVGVAPSISKADGVHRMDSSISLRAQKGVRRSAFHEDAVTVGDTLYPLAANIDNCCYNARSKTWFASLDEALAYSDTLTVYYERPYSQGGKIRLVVVE